MGQREDEADDHWTEFGDGPSYDPADYEPSPAPSSAADAKPVAWLTPGGGVTRSRVYAVEQSVTDPANYPKALGVIASSQPAPASDESDGPPVIWLQPSCCVEPIEGRQWSEDQFAEEECEGHPQQDPTKYVRAGWSAELSDSFDRAFLNGPSDDEAFVRDWIKRKRISHLTHDAADAMERILDRAAQPQPGLQAGGFDRDVAARAVYAARPARYLHTEERDITWDEAQTECSDRITQIYRDVDAILATPNTSKPAP